MNAADYSRMSGNDEEQEMEESVALITVPLQ